MAGLGEARLGPAWQARHGITLRSTKGLAMKRELAFILFIAVVAFGSAAVFIAAVSAAANASVFSVTDEDRGIYNLHHELVKEHP